VAAFKSQYAKIYDLQYKTSYKTAFDDQRETAFEKHKMDKYQESYDAAYAQAYATASERGANDAKQEGFREGRVAGYQENIESLRAQAYQLGLSDETTYFASNPVLRVESVKVRLASELNGSEKPFKANDLLAIDLVVTNFGEAASDAESIGLVFDSLSSNLVLQTREPTLKSIPGKTRATIKNVAFAKISKSMGRGSLSMTLKSKSNDGELQQFRKNMSTDLFVITENVIKMDTTPDIYKRRAGSRPGPSKTIATQYVYVEVTNPLNENAEKTIRATLSGPNLEDLDITDSSDSVDKLKARDTDKLKMTYKIRSRNLAGRSIPLTIRVFYGDQLTAEYVVNVVPRNN